MYTSADHGCATRFVTVHVLLAVHNGARWLAEQLNSVLMQSGVNVLLTVSLDNCTDHSEEICGRFASQFSNIRILKPGYPLGSAGKNFFFLFCNADLRDCCYVACCDQDDIWLPHKLSRAVSELQARNADGYSSDLTAFDSSTGRSWTIRKCAAQRSLDYLFQGASAGCTYVVSRHAAELIQTVLQRQPFLQMPRPSHDWALYAICRSHGLVWIFDSGFSAIRYRQHDRNAYGARRNLASFLKKLGMVRRGWYGAQIRHLHGALSGTDMEARVLRAIQTNRLRDRIWLIANVQKFRRERTSRAMLALLLFFRLL